ncbi:MAG TPA: prephenate dehydrogenase/arogenate dehydrogenase family protein [Acidimicrobiales bacterium]|nr:prephenate dehydrogenase/arogenate dehydrogenase family protein [Acidimicrobiales bacterium]
MVSSRRGETARRRAQVVGLGLIGSSVGLAMRSAGWQVSGEDLDPARARRALELGAVDRVGRDDEASVAVVATPVSTVPTVAADLLARGRADLVVTDVGGVKGPVVAAVGHPRFVGGHPMAGSEQEGPDGADAELFSGATWVITPTLQTDPRAYALVRSLVGSLGAEVVDLEPDRHDALVAVVSHVPHLTAATLMALAADAAVEQGALLRLAAGGFRDMTRVAAGSPAIWPDVFRDNADAVLRVLDELAARIAAARSIVAEQRWTELVDLLEHAREARRNLPPRIAAPEELAELRVPVPDRAGVLAEVTTLLGGLGVNVADLEIAHSAEGDRGVLVMAVDVGDADKARAALADLGYRAAVRRMT